MYLNRRDIGIVSRAENNGERKKRTTVDSKLTSRREMGTFTRIGACCKRITEVRTAIGDHLRHLTGICPHLT